MRRSSPHARPASLFLTALFAAGCLGAPCDTGGEGTPPPGDGSTTSSSSSSSSSSSGSTSSSSSSSGAASSSSSSSSSSSGSASSSSSSSGSASSSSSSSSSSGGGGAPGGYLHTSGSKILDAQGNVIRITGLNWFGLETSNYAPHGLWTRSLGSMLDTVESLGYNTLRLPFSNQLLDPGSTPNGIDTGKNPELAGKSGLEILDAVIAGAGARGLKVILDRHRPDSGGQSPLWYTAQYDEARWIDDWKLLAARYKDNPTVIGADLHNEPHGPATWGSGDPATDFRLAAQKAGNAILSVNPDLLIIVEGVEQADNTGYWWGGNLHAAGAKPVTLDVDHRVVYSTHDYPSTVANQPWFNDPSYPQNLPAVWDDRWGYLVENDIAPVLVGEFGTKYETSSDKAWMNALATYIGQHGLSFTYWCLNPNSGDTGGILMDDWTTVNQDKQAVLAPILAPLLP